MSWKIYILVCSKFEDNFGGKGATIDFSFYNAMFENVMFSNNRGPVIRVSICNNAYTVCNIYI